MWTERPRALVDGLLMVTALGLVMSVIVSFGREPEQSAPPLTQCQEVVVSIHEGEEILAQCPSGTWLDIVDNLNVVCRCGQRREPLWFERRRPPIHPTPQTNPPPLSDDKRGTEI